MEGFLNIRLRPWLRRLITRLIAIIPAVFVTVISGEKGTDESARAQPGDPEPAIEFRGFPARPVHERQDKDGRVRQRPDHEMACLVRRDKSLHCSTPGFSSRLSETGSPPNQTMYNTILVPVENRETDQRILRHIRSLARLTNAKLMLVHVADGLGRAELRALSTPGKRRDEAGRANISPRFRRNCARKEYEVKAVLAMGDPADGKLSSWPQPNRSISIAMTTHGHRLVADLLHGSTGRQSPP